MALVIKRDRFPAGLDLQQQQNRFVERVIIEGTTITPGSESEVLFDVYDDSSFPKLGVAHTNRPEYILRRVVFDSVGYDIASALLYWEVDGFGGTPSVSVLTESTILSQYTSNLCPNAAARTPIKTLAHGAIPADFVTFSFLTPHRQVNVNQLMAGELPEDHGSEVGKVNDADWRGLGVAFWLLSEHTTSISKYTGYYQRRLSAISRVRWDWREGGIVRGSDGKYDTAAESTLLALMTAAYSFGVHSDEGCVAVCPYPTTDFDAFFDI